MPNPRIWNRRLHRWGAVAIALPFLLMLASGLLLQVKKQLPWVQPPEQGGRASETAPTLSMPDVLERVRQVPEAGIRSWADIDRVDVRPAKNMMKVISLTRWEIQLEIATGEVLQVAYRRSDLIESLHDGSWFHPMAKLAVFLPTGVIVLGLWLTGMYLWLLPFRARRTARRKRAVVEGSRGAS